MNRVGYLAIVLFAAFPGFMAQGANEIFGSGYTGPYVPGVAPGDVITLFVVPLNMPDAVASQTPLPTSLSGVSISVRANDPLQVDTTGYPTSLPIFRIHSVKNLFIFPNTAITVQIPTDTVTINYQGNVFKAWPQQLILNVKANGISGPDLVLESNSLAPHLLNSCDTVFGGVGPTLSGAGCNPVITHADGTVVSYASPAKVGETVVVYALGLGPYAAPDALIYFTYVLDPPPQSSLESMTARYLLNPVYVGLVQGYVGCFRSTSRFLQCPPKRMCARIRQTRTPQSRTRVHQMKARVSACRRKRVWTRDSYQEQT
ncbi:MAG TPA: hypothetical protein VKV15_18500 [Bryobacteraceae bacterium]|nr:hypothetical protein [Bryobacteraceae bacterium]